MSAAPEISRFVVVESIYHQHHGRQPTGTEHRYQRWLSSNDQPYVRELHLTEEWAPLDCGWLKSASLLHLHNIPPSYKTYPTPGEAATNASKIIEVGLLVHPPITVCFVVPPGETFRASPANLTPLYLRCRRGTANCTLTLFPE